METELCHLPDSEAAVQNTDVCVNTHQSDVGDAFLLAEAVDLLPAVADTVKTDNIQGWVFARFLTAQVGGDGVARLAWIPPSVGRWRIDARFRGTITRSPSRSGTATLLVGEPL